MNDQLLPLELLTERFRRLPGVGKKSAMRMALSVIEGTDEDARAFADVIIDAKRQIRYCTRCGYITTGELCGICDDDGRDRSTVCVVEDVRAVMSLERMKNYRGVYHVLGGTISPIDGRGPDCLNIASLIKRIENGGIGEIVIATNSTVEGETTAMYLQRIIKPFGLKVSRLAYGIPVGGDLEYADEMTLSRAFEGRTTVF